VKTYTNVVDLGKVQTFLFCKSRTESAQSELFPMHFAGEERKARDISPPDYSRR